MSSSYTASLVEDESKKPQYQWRCIDNEEHEFDIPDHEAWQIENLRGTLRGLVFQCFGDGGSTCLFSPDGKTLRAQCSSMKCWMTHEQRNLNDTHLDCKIICNSEEKLAEIVRIISR